MRKIPAAAILLLLSAPSLAQPAIKSIPPSLYRVDGKPVPSSCLATLATAQELPPPPLDLAHCGDPGMKPKTLPTGMVGYDDPNGGYFYYRYIGQLNGIDILYAQYSGGGSGEFTDLFGVRRDGHMLRQVQAYSGGDRCNGSVSNVALANGHLLFDKAVTPYDLIALAGPNTRLVAYKDLEASASSCVALSHMRDDDKHWTGVSLTEALQDQKGWTEQYRFEACFNALDRQMVAQKQTELDRAAVAAFADRFTKHCVQAKP